MYRHVAVACWVKFPVSVSSGATWFLPDSAPFLPAFSLIFSHLSKFCPINRPRKFVFCFVFVFVFNSSMVFTAYRGGIPHQQWAVMWVLGISPGSSKWADCAVNHGSISPAPEFLDYFYWTYPPLEGSVCDKWCRKIVQQLCSGASTGVGAPLSLCASDGST